MKLLTVLLALCTVASALDFDTTGPSARGQVLLYDKTRGNAEPVGSRILPRRLHTRYDETLDRWVWFLTDAKGRLPQPPEALGEGSVVAGEKMGAPGRGNFKLLEDGTWEPTPAGEEYRLTVMTNPPKKKLRYPASQRS